MDLSTTLDECLARLLRGESVDACLAAYPEHAPELAPLLAVAAQLRSTLPQMQLTPGQRLRAKVVLREAVAAQARRRTARRPFSWARLTPAAGLVTALVIVVVMLALVASSTPGNAGYSLRLVAERAPVWVTFSAAGKAEREVALAHRRLSEVRDELMLRGKVHPATCAELLRLDEAALRRATLLPPDQQAAIVSQVAAHASELAALAGLAVDADSQARLQAVGEQVRLLAEQQVVVTEPVQPVVSPTPTLMPQGALPAAQDAALTPTPSGEDGPPTIGPVATAVLAAEPLASDPSPSAPPPTAVAPSATPRATSTRPRPSARPTATLTSEPSFTPPPPAEPPQPEPELPPTDAPTAAPTAVPVVAATAPNVEPTATAVVTTAPNAEPTATAAATVDVPQPPGMSTPPPPSAEPKLNGPTQTSAPAARKPARVQPAATRLSPKNSAPIDAPGAQALLPTATVKSENQRAQATPPPAAPKASMPKAAATEALAAVQVKAPAAPKQNVPPGRATTPKRKP
jgi:hypothetical protein